MLFSLDFACEMILFLFFSLSTYFLIPTVITLTFNPIAELVIPIGITKKEAKAETETHPVIAEIAVSESSI